MPWENSSCSKIIRGESVQPSRTQRKEDRERKKDFFLFFLDFISIQQTLFARKNKGGLIRILESRFE